MGRLYDAYVMSHVLTKENAREFFDIVGDIYDSPQFQLTDSFIQHANISLMQHMLSVSYLSFLNTKEKNLNYISATRAAMVHDLVDYDWHIAGDGSHRLHGYRHPGFAIKNASKLFELSDLEKYIIRRHMWPLTPIPPLRRESIVVTLVDKFCAVQEMLIKSNKNYRNKFLKDLEEAKG